MWLAAPAEPDAVTESSDTLSIVKEDATPSNVDVAVALAEATPLAADRVLIGRDDVFVDSMAAGVLQGDSPLLLVPRDGPVPTSVLDTLSSSGAARVTLLGGEAAVSAPVADELASAGYSVERRAGVSRFETAIDIARSAPPSDTAILVRAFAAEGATDPTQAFADSLGAGYMAAENGWPILLTQSDVLTGSTRDFITEQGYQRVLILGGTAAVADSVADAVAAIVPAVERIAGPDRFSTAVEIAKETGAESAADVARVTLVEAQGADAWAGGFAAAAHAAFHDAPIVLSTGDAVPGPTAAWLRGGDAGFAQNPDGVRLTCVAPFAACVDARQDLSLPALVDVTFTPATGATVATGSSVTVAIAGGQAADVGGSCVAQGGPLQPDGRIVLDQGSAGGTCTVVVSITLAGGTIQTETATYGLAAAVGPSLVSIGPDGTAAGGEYPGLSHDGAAIAFISGGDPTGAGATGEHVYLQIHGGAVLAIDVRADGTLGESLLASLRDAPVVVQRQNLYGVVFTSPDPALDSQGRIGTDTGSNVYLRDIGTGTTRLVSLDGEGNPVRAAEIPAASNDGRIVSYTGTGVAAPGGSASLHIFVHDLTTGTVDVVRTHTGEPFFNASNVLKTVMSADGSTLVFAESRSDIVADDRNARPDLFAYDIGQRRVEMVTVTSDGQQTVGDAQNVPHRFGVSGDGNVIVFRSAATNLGSSGSGADLYLRDRAARTTTVLVDRGDGPAFEDGTEPWIDSAGRYVAFATTDAPPGETRTGCGIYRLDLLTQQLVRVDVAADGSTNGGCSGAHVSVGTDGTVTFASDATLAPGDVGSGRDVYRG